MNRESSSSSIDSIQDRPMGIEMGTETELIRIEKAQLYLLDGTESVVMGTGAFSVIMVVQATTQLSTLVAQVAEFQWPISKDAPALRIANLRYTFAVPDLVYGLILPDITSNEDVQRFESNMRQYCTFEIRPEIGRAAGMSDLRLRPSVGCYLDEASEEVRYWNAIADDAEGYSTKLVRLMQDGSKVAADSRLRDGERSETPRSTGRGGSDVKDHLTDSPGARAEGEEMSARMRKRVQQARRMSAVAKLLSRTVLKGALSATGHVANFLGSAFMNNGSRRDVVVASVDAFVQVVKAVETAGKSLLAATGSVQTEMGQQTCGEETGQAAQDGIGNVIDTMWTLNKLGLYMLWRATAASTALNHGNRSRGRSGVSSRSSSGTSSVTSSQTQMVSSSPGLSTGLSSPSVNTSRQPSLSAMERTTSFPAPMDQDDVTQTAQLFPGSPDHVQQQFYSTVPPNAYVHKPQAIPIISVGYSPYYQIAQNSPPIRHFRRPGAPPRAQPFFPRNTEASKFP